MLPPKGPKKNIPPLKDLPEEEHSDSSTESSEHLLNELLLEKHISQLKKDLNYIENNLFQDFVQVFKKIGQIDFRKKDKIEKMNRKLAEEDRIETKLTDWVFTEQSLKQGFKSIF
jgi:hypothetical protein